jgi:melatonin receptor type 1B
MPIANQEHTGELAFELAHRPLAQVIVETGILVLITLTAFVGNSCVLYVFYKTPSYRSVTGYCLISLATSDVILSMFVLLTSIATSANGGDVFFDNVAKLLDGFMLGQYSYLYTTALIAINRFFCVVKPLVYKKYCSRKTLKRTIAGLWVFVLTFILILYLSGAITFEFYPGRVVYSITCSDKTASVLTAVAHFILIILPLALTGICYWKLFLLVKGHNATASADAGNCSASTLTKEEIHVTRCLLALVCRYVICWIPCSILYHVAIYVHLPRPLEMVIVCTAYMSSAINPFLFNILNRRFRKRFLKLIWPVKNTASSGTQG